MEQKENVQPNQQQELTPEIALNTLYSATRQLTVSADNHDILKNCALKLKEVIDRDKQTAEIAKKLNEKSKKPALKIVERPDGDEIQE